MKAVAGMYRQTIMYLERYLDTSHHAKTEDRLEEIKFLEENLKRLEKKPDIIMKEIETRLKSELKEGIEGTCIFKLISHEYAPKLFI